MEKLFVVSSKDPLTRESVFREALGLAHELHADTPEAMASEGDAKAAVYRRQNGTGGGFARNPEHGSWIVSVGTWFHEEGYASGSEHRLLQRFHEAGAERLSRELDGFFAIVIGDSRTGETFVLTDPLGSCHVFLREVPGAIAVSTSSVLLAGLSPAAALDPVGVQEFLTTGIIYEDRSLHAGVRKLEGARVARIASGSLRGVTRTWHVSDVKADQHDGDAAVDALHDELVRTFRRIHSLFPRVCADLTGGYDSRAVVAGLMCAGVPFTTTVTGDADHIDVTVAQEVAEAANLRHLYLASRPPLYFDAVKSSFAATDGAYDMVEYSRIQHVHEQLSARFDVSLNGSAGEIARGRWWEHLGPRPGVRRPLDARAIAAKRFAIDPPAGPLFAPRDRVGMLDHFSGVVARTVSGLESVPDTIQMNWVYLAMRMQSWQGRIASSTNRLWPVLSPFLFRSVLRTTLGMTTGIRSRSLVVRRFLAEFQPALAAPNTDNGYPPIPFTLATAHRFRGLPGYFAGRAFRKISRKLGVQGAPLPSRPEDLPPRIHLALEDEVRELLRPDSLSLNSIADPAALRSFLAQSEAGSFPLDAQWCRLLSIEYASRRLNVARSAVRRSPVLPATETLPA